MGSQHYFSRRVADWLPFTFHPQLMRLRFTKENMYTAAGFERDALLTDQADFLAVAPTEFDAAFIDLFKARHQAIEEATGAALRQGGGTQTTTRLYQSLDAVKPLLDRLDIRLGLLEANALTVPAKSFDLKTLRDRISARDAEAVSRALTVLRRAIADNLAALQTKGYQEAELAELTRLHTAIDADNARQNTNLTTSTQATEAEDQDYQALDQLLGKVMRTGRLLYKSNKTKRRQYEAAAILKRVQAAGPTLPPPSA